MKKNTLVIVLVLTNLISLGILLNVHLNLKRTWNERARQQAQVLKQQKLDNFQNNPHYALNRSLHALYGTKSQQIVMLGTSLTAGLNWQEAFPAHGIANRGIGSDVAEGMCYRIGDVLALHPTLCCVEAGTNDILFQYPVSTTMRFVNGIIDSLQGHRVQVLFTLIPLFARSHQTAESSNINVSQLNDSLRGLCKRRGIPVIDLNSVIAENGFRKPEYSQADGVHLNASGYSVWIQALQAHFLQLQKK